MSEWYGSQKKPSGDFRNLLQERLDKANPRREELTKEETTKLVKLEAIAAKLKRGENVQNRQQQTWLSDDEYAQIEMEWQEQLELRVELKDKPSELRRYEEKLRQVSIGCPRISAPDPRPTSTSSIRITPSSFKRSRDFHDVFSFESTTPELKKSSATRIGVGKAV